MRSLKPPVDENDQPYCAGDVFASCASMVKDRALRARMLCIRSIIDAEASDYLVKAQSGELYKKQPHAAVGAVSGKDLVKLYVGRMVRKGSSGRAVYDRIISQPPHGRCPLCGIGTVNTLDHYLPKTHFPVLSVTPNNLVPACTWCQGAKREYYPTAHGQQLLHPYFDDLDGEIWLKAEVVAGTPAGFRFFASPPADWSADSRARVAAHLNKLNLAALFTSNAGSRLSEIRLRLSGLLLKGGATAVRAQLQEELESAEADQKNSWMTAMYRAAIASDWFCEGGFQGV